MLKFGFYFVIHTQAVTENWKIWTIENILSGKNNE